MDREPRRALVMALIVATSSAQVTAPAVIIVGGDCTLPEAIDAANTDLPVGGCDAGSGADEVRLTEDVRLEEVNNYASGANGLPLITSEIALNGYGFAIKRSLAAPPFRIFKVESNGTLTLASVRLKQGFTDPGQYWYGGAIHSTGAVRLIASTVADNEAWRGGGIYSAGYLGVIETRIVRNVAAFGGGGGIRAGGPTVMIASTIADNLVFSVPYGGSSYGGGISLSGTLYLADSTVKRNIASGDYAAGGGLSVGGSATIVRSTFSDNVSSRWGGGLNVSGHLVMANSTISRNTGDYGGGIYAQEDADVLLINSTVAGNEGAGIYSYANRPVRVSGTVLGHQSRNCAGMLEDLGGTLADDDTCGPDVGLLTGLDPMLRDNGGTTRTHALLPESSAIDAAGDCEQATDQRGFVRDALCDSGSFEFGAVPLRVALAGSCPGALTVGIRGASADGPVAVLRASRAGLFRLAAGPCAGTLVGLADPRPLAQVTADADGMFVTEVNTPAAACGDLLQVVDLLSCAVSNVAAIP